MNAAALLFLAGCAPKQSIRMATCHVVSVDEFAETTTPDRPTRTGWVAWCGEGKYVIFHSSVTPSEVVTYTEFQQDTDLQAHGYIAK